jgi:hypothetical protein
VSVLPIAAVTTHVPSSKDSEPGSPAWWLRRLHGVIQLRRPGFDRLQRYYDGDFDLKYADERLRQTFGNVFHADRFGVNWSRLVVGAVEERLQVDGFRVGKGVEAADPRAWDLWQAANLDETSSMAHLEALINGVAYVTVWPGEDARWPDITIEHPAQAYVEVDPKTPQKRLAGLRLYVDSWGYLRGELFLPDAVYLYRSANTRQGTWDAARIGWAVDTALTDDGQMANPWGVVPMVPLSNVPQLLVTASAATTAASAITRRSELWPVMPIQDAINSALFNALLVANAQGYRQRWVTGLELEVDAQTGKAKEPFKGGIDRLFVSEDAATKFGEFTATDVTPLIGLLDQLVHSLGSVAQVPPHYLSAHADRLSGESIKAAETGLLSRVRRKQVGFGGTWEEVMRLAGLMTDNTALAEAHAAEVLWANPETRSEAQVADAALKMAQVGVPWRQVMEHLGYSPQAIALMEADRANDMTYITRPTRGAAPPTGEPLDQPPDAPPPEE